MLKQVTEGLPPEYPWVPSTGANQVHPVQPSRCTI